MRMINSGDESLEIHAHLAAGRLLVGKRMAPNSALRLPSLRLSSRSGSLLSSSVLSRDACLVTVLRRRFAGDGDGIDGPADSEGVTLTVATFLASRKARRDGEASTLVAPLEKEFVTRLYHHMYHTLCDL